MPISVLQQLLMITEGNVAIIAAENNLYTKFGIIISIYNLIVNMHDRGPQGAKMVGDIAGKMTCVDHLDLADNGFGDAGLAMLVEVRILERLYVGLGG